MNAELTGPVITAWVTFACFLVPPTAFGLALSLRFSGAFFLGERILLGLTIGLALATGVGFLCTLLLGFHAFVIWGVLTLMLVSAILLLQRSRFSIFKAAVHLHKNWSRVDTTGLLVFMAALLVFTILAQRLILWQNGALATGYIDAWGDLPLHISIIMSFFTNGQVALHSTILAGEPLTYPFLSDFMSAMLMRVGLPLEHAVELPAVMMNAVTLTLLFYLAYRLVRHRAAAALTPALLILAGGLGFLWFFSDLFYTSKPIWEFLRHLPQRYTNLDGPNIHWVNPVLAHLLPQRSFLFGFPLGLSIILLWWNQIGRQRPRDACLTGGLAGMLPLFHTHTFMVLLIVAVIFSFTALLQPAKRTKYLRYWLVWGVAAIVVAAPQLFYLLHSKVSLGGIRFHVGWMAGNENVVWFWLKNTGLFVPLTLVAIFLRKRLGLRQRALRFYVPFGGLFLICNFFLFASFSYDTNKVLIFWLLLSLPFIAKLLTTMFSSKSWWVSGFTFRMVLLTLTLSGLLNLVRELQGGGWPELSAEEVQLAGKLSAKTDHDAVFLTAPIHNNLLTLAGRAVVLGYPGHVASHGLNPQPVEVAIERIYKQDARAEAYLSRYDVDYIVAGPNERQRYGDGIKWLSLRFPIFAQSENYLIYRVKPEIDRGQRTRLTPK